ncbi:MAG: hypothetical protein ACRD6W_17190 [Nitrososphaerales archaeon]
MDVLNRAFASKLLALRLPPPQAEPTRSAGLANAGPALAFCLSLRFHARDPRAVALGRLGGEEENPAGAPSGPAPVLVVCSTCRQPIRLNEVLRISYCPIHGLSQPFTFIPFGRRRRLGA